MNSFPDISCLSGQVSGSRFLNWMRPALIITVVLGSMLANVGVSQDDTQSRAEKHQEDEASGDRVVHLPFESDRNSDGVEGIQTQGDPDYVKGLVGEAIRISNPDVASFLNFSASGCKFGNEHDFSIRFWVRTTMSSDKRCILVSNKAVPDNSLGSQKSKGWAFSFANGTWGWNVGSGNRRVSYDRFNGEYMRINDGRWHQLAMTHEASRGLIRLYFDGRNLVTYNIKDSSGFDFGNEDRISVGWDGDPQSGAATELAVFTSGAKQLQRMVDLFNQIGLPPVKSDEFSELVSRPARLLATKVEQLKQEGNSENNALLEKAGTADLREIETISKRLMRSPYTVHQGGYYREVAAIFRLYHLNEGTVQIDAPTAERLAKREVLHRPSFDMDELAIWDRVLSPEEVQASYSQFFSTVDVETPQSVGSLTAGSWNIYHGGIHHSIEEHGWDSRQVIIDLLKREKIDIVMMQETYSSGDYIAAELGYYYATTVDWDNMHQGANLSVISRYPIKDVYVPPKSAFMSVGTKVSVSQTQDLYVISNWFGMRNFDDVYAFHQPRFQQADDTPVLFAGDFNAIPHTDGGSSPASVKLLESGFVDAYRERYPDVKTYPGYTHRSDRRIDQLYYKGKDLKNTATEVISTWPSLFPADHYLIKSVFELGGSAKE